MNPNMKKAILFLLVAMFVFAPVMSSPLPANAQERFWGTEEGSAGDVQGILGLGESDPREIAASVINILLGFLGIIAVIIILIGGFKWMTAGGNEDQVGEAKKMIVAGIIGLLIILSAYAIATFVLEALFEATGGDDI
jgi:hypothetical protein